MKRIFTILPILLLALLLRLYKIDIPLADHHSWRQADSAAVIRNLAEEKFDPFRPRWDNLVPTNEKSLPNPQRYFFEDFPLGYDVYPALLYKIFGSKEFLARLVSIFFSLGSIVFLYLLMGIFDNFWVAALSALFLAVLPFSIFYSRTILQEPAAIFYLLAGIYFLARGIKNEKKLLLLISAILVSLSLLTKIYSLFYLPLFLYLFWQKEGINFFKKKYFYVYFLVVLLPVGIWWWWINRHPEGLPYSWWLLNEGKIRFKGAWFYWLFAERVGKLILGYWGVFLFVLGLILKPGKEKNFFHLWFGCLILFFIVFAKGNVTHDYYQIISLPVICIFLARGSYFLLTAPEKYFSRFVCCLLFVVCCLFMFAFSWYYVRDFYNIKGGVDLAGAAVSRLTPKDSLVIAGDGSDPTLLYNTSRKGWAIGYGSIWENTPSKILELKQKGARFYVTTKISELKGSDFGKFMYENFPVLEETDQFVIFELKGR